ncbi:MAG TPA: acyltransferase, partial [Chitinophagaceae bacterium]|nr:acyltransferase [Chitinophagaceae bacterium]
LLIVFLVIWNIPYFQSNYFLSGKQEIPFWSYFLMIHNFFMANYETLGNDTLSITWSIGIEEQFYLLFPFLIYFLDKKWIPWLLGTLVFVAIGFRSLFDHWIPRYVLLPARMDGLAIGFLIGYLNQTGLLDKHRKQILTASMFIFPVILVTCAFLYWKYGDLGVGKHTLFAIVFGIMIIYALKLSRSWYGSLLRNKALMWIGTISYSLYLFHYLMLVLVFHFAGYTGTGIFGIKEVILVIVAFISSLIISWLIYRLLEQPMVKIGKRFTY